MTGPIKRKRNIIRLTAPLILAVPLAFCFSPAALGAEEPIEGPIAILQAAVSEEPAAKEDSLDVDYSGRIDAADAALLLRYEQGYVSTMPLPGGAAAPLLLTDTRAAVEKIVARSAANTSDQWALLAQTKPTAYGELAQNRAEFLRIGQTILEGLTRATADCMPVLSRDFAEMDLPLNGVAYEPPAPDWRMVAALYHVFGDDAEKAFASAAQVGWRNSGDGAVAMEIGGWTLDRLAAFGDESQQVRVRLAYAYLNTVFADDGSQRPREKQTYSAAYLATVAHPLPGCIIKNGWYDPRDRHTRYHMGTDILAAGRSHIHAVTDGVVLFTGYLPVPGNYVILRDPAGYEYHYYHMFEKTRYVQPGDTVRQGDVIGLVGNTGNSAANHLHLAVISPEYRYENPYDLLVQAGAEPIKPDF